MLYIPFWLYSNNKRGRINAEKIHFTFHSGYILIKAEYRQAEEIINLYIPFWLYSNHPTHLCKPP